MKASAQVRLLDGRMVVELPPAIVEKLDLKADQIVRLKAEGTRLTVETGHRPLYTLAELIADSDPSAADDPKILEWQNAPAVGREIV